MKFALVRLVGGMVAGGLVFLSYQPVGWWWVAHSGGGVVVCGACAVA